MNYGIGMDNFIEQFRAALLWKLSVSGRKQYDIADSCGVITQYLTHIKNGNKNGSEEVGRDLSREFDLTYEEMLSLDQHIIKTGSAEGWKQTANINCELPSLGSNIRIEEENRNMKIISEWIDSQDEPSDYWIELKQYLKKESRVTAHSDIIKRQCTSRTLVNH